MKKVSDRIFSLQGKHSNLASHMVLTDLLAIVALLLNFTVLAWVQHLPFPFPKVLFNCTFHKSLAYVVLFVLRHSSVHIIYYTCSFHHLYFFNKTNSNDKLNYTSIVLKLWDNSPYCIFKDCTFLNVCVLLLQEISNH